MPCLSFARPQRARRPFGDRPAPLAGPLLVLLLGTLLTTLSTAGSTTASTVGAAPVAAQEEGGGSIEELVRRIVERGDSGDVAVIQELANRRTGAALEALMDVYTKLDSIYMRRAVLQGIALYDQVDGQGQAALQALTDAATLSSDRELRLAAVDLIGRCRNLGRPFLAILALSHADDEVREEALRRHAGGASDLDHTWYREIWTGKKAESGGEGKRRRRGAEPEEDAPAPPPPLPVLREIAFEVLASSFAPDELYRAAIGGPTGKVRALALRELDARGDERTEDLLERLFRSPGAELEDRLYAARGLLRLRGEDFGEEILEEGTRKAQSESFALALADLVTELDDEELDREVLKKVGKGKGLERLFWVRAARGLEDPKLLKGLVKLISDKDPLVARAALESIAAQRLFDARPALEKLIDKTKDVELLTEALRTMTALRRGDPEWEAELVGRTASEERSIRNTALRALADTNNPAYLELLAEALGHVDWSTRLAAVRGLVEGRRAAAVGPLVARMQEESGRMRLEIADALFQLTGQPFRVNAPLWATWWKDAEEGFEVISKSDLRKRRKDEEERRLRQVTRTEFFGVKVESTRVTFILDVSGSMLEPTRSRYANEAGRMRIELAKEELVRVLDGLDRASFFNLIVFSDIVSAWADEVTAYDPEALLDAKEYVQRLRAGGGTNLFGALELALEDPEVDTIFVLSDGEPTVGSVIDPGGIRSRVQAWNRDRNVVIHTIAVGGSLQVLEWLALDTGGKHVRFP